MKIKAFDREDEGAFDRAPSPRLVEYLTGLAAALIPDSGESTTVQGELLRANLRLASEFLNNGGANYYVEEETLETNYYGALVTFMLDTLIDNRGGGLGVDDVAYFQQVRSDLEEDWARACRINALELSEDALTPEEVAELQALEPIIDFETLCNRAERCIANWILVNETPIPRPGFEARVPNLHATKCVRCGGKGFLMPKDPQTFAEICSCKLGT